MSPLAALRSCQVGGRLKLGVSRHFLARPEGVARIRYGTEMRVEDWPKWDEGW